MKLRDTRIVLLLSLLIVLVTSCIGTRMGTANLTEDSVATIEEGKTTKDQIAALLGHPENMMNQNKAGLDEYIYRLTLKKQPKEAFPEDNYEIWTYSSWTHKSSLFTPGSATTDRALVIIFNSSDICVKKLYDEKSQGGW